MIGVKKAGCRGQALLELIGFTLALAGLLSVTLSFTKWFLIRQRLLMAAREGAMLYSSGHFTPEQVRQELTRFLKTGMPALDPKRLSFYLGRSCGWQARLYRLDEIRVQFRPRSAWIRALQPVMEEKCTIKHAPHYGPLSQPFWGPAVPW